jgi:hypothetical protein
VASFDLFQVIGQKNGTPFCAGLILKDARYMRAAPILRGVIAATLSYPKFAAYARRRGWEILHVSSWEEEED